MPRRPWALPVVVLVGAMSADLSACGDKFIRLASRLGFVSERPAAVLLYVPPGSVGAAASEALDLQRRLRHAGHRVDTIDRPSDLPAALTARRYDIVVADVDQAVAVQAQVDPLGSRPTYVPLFNKPSKGALKDARKHYGCLISASDSRHWAAAEIEHVMAVRKTGAVAP